MRHSTHFYARKSIPLPRLQQKAHPKIQGHQVIPPADHKTHRVPPKYVLGGNIWIKKIDLCANIFPPPLSCVTYKERTSKRSSKMWLLCLRAAIVWEPVVRFASSASRPQLHAQELLLEPLLPQQHVVYVDFEST